MGPAVIQVDEEKKIRKGEKKNIFQASLNHFEKDKNPCTNTLYYVYIFVSLLKMFLRASSHIF
jgi:hypothetical protein